MRYRYKKLYINHKVKKIIITHIYLHSVIVYIYKGCVHLLQSRLFKKILFLLNM